MELELHGLAVNTLVNAAYLNDIEGSAMLDNSASCSAALTSLQQLVTNWYVGSSVSSSVSSRMLFVSLAHGILLERMVVV